MFGEWKGEGPILVDVDLFIAGGESLHGHFRVEEKWMDFCFVFLGRGRDCILTCSGG